MSTVYEIPLLPAMDQTLQVSLSGTSYVFKLRWNTVSICWILDIYQSDGVTPAVRGIPLITGADLFRQYPEFSFGGSLVVLTLGGSTGQSPFEVPTFENLGVDSHLYYTVP